MSNARTPYRVGNQHYAAYGSQRGPIADTSCLQQQTDADERVGQEGQRKADATSCHEIDPTIVVMMAPHRPVLKNSCKPSETPKMFSSSSPALRVMAQAMIKKHDTTQSCRQITHFPVGLLTWQRNRSSQVFVANGAFPRSDLGSFSTAKKTIYIPSSKPTTDTRRKKRITEMASGTPPHMVVMP